MSNKISFFIMDDGKIRITGKKNATGLYFTVEEAVETTKALLAAISTTMNKQIDAINSLENEITELKKIPKISKRFIDIMTEGE